MKEARYLSLLRKNKALGIVLGIVFSAISFSLQAQVQDPYTEELLKKVGNKYKSYKSVKFNFVRRVESPDNKVLESTAGELAVAGNKFNLKLKEQTLICNGNTLWTYVPADNEVTVNDYEPGADELSPGNIFTIWQNGYKYALIGEIKDNKTVLQIIDLEPIDRKKDIYKIRILVDKAGATIKKWTVFERGSNNKQVYVIQKLFANQPVTADMFNFDKTKFPKTLKIVDLR